MSTTAEVDFGEDYLSYPRANESMDLDFYCLECAEEWTCKIVLRISIEAVA